MEKLYIYFYKEKEKVFLWIPKLLKLKDKCYKQCYHIAKRKPNNERNNNHQDLYNGSWLPEEGGHDVMS